MKEKIFYNGVIITMEEDTYAEAVFIRNGTIIRVGTKDEVFSHQTKETEMIDLSGKTMLPAFIDSHSHLTAFATTLRLVPLHDANSFAAIIQQLQSYKEKNNIKPREWIIGFGYDHNDLKEKQHPTKDILNQVSSEHPIIISHASGHMGVMNSVALHTLHITKDTPNPEGGMIGRVGSSTEPNGYLEENAFLHSSAKIPQPSLEEVSKLIYEAQNIYCSYGIATAQEGIVNGNEFYLLKHMSDTNRLKIDVIGYVDLKNSKDLADSHQKYLNYVNHFKIGGYKIFLDGSPQGKTAWLTKPYQNEKDDYRGYPIYKDEEVQTFVKTALDEQLQLLTHCNGDAACDQLITSFETVLQNQDYHHTNRPVMIHAQTVRYDQLAKMKPIHMIPSFFMEHTYYWGDTHIQNLGPERANRISPAKTAIENGLYFTLHQDSPVVAPDMLHTVWCAVNRITKSGTVIGDFEKISPLEALKGVTIHAAYQYFEEAIKGSIKEGKQADLVILNRNPLTVEPKTIKDIHVLQTIKAGETVFKRD